MKLRNSSRQPLGLIVLAFTTAALSSPSAQGAAQTWDAGGGTQDWNTATNWTADVFPTGNAIVNTSTGLFPIITVTPTWTGMVDLFVANGTTTTGRVDQIGGTVATGVGNWMKAGNGGSSVGVYNLADTSTTGGSLTGFGLGTGSLTVGSTSTTSGRLVLGDGGTSQGTFNMNTSGTLTTRQTASSESTAAALIVARNGGTGTFRMDNGTVNTQRVELGRSSGSGTLNLGGGTFNAGTMLIACSTAATSTGAGTVTVGSGATLNVSGELAAGYGGVSTTQGTLNVSGTVKLTAGGAVLNVGVFDAVQGFLNINSGADIQMQNNSSMRLSVAAGNTTTNVVNHNGGSVTYFSNAGTTVGGTGALDMQLAGGVSTNTYNLNGGTLTVPQIKSTANAGSRIFNLNGGTLKATASTAAFMNLGTGTTRANVRNSGAVIDTNGFDITVAQALVHSDISGDNATDGGLTKQAAGNLILSAANTYTGATLISNGTLTLSTNGNVNSSSSVTINGSGAKLVQASATGINPPVTLTQGSLDGKGSINSLAVANSVGNSIAVGNGTAGTLTVGTLNFGGAATLNLRANAFASDQYLLATNLSTSASADVVVNITNSSSTWTSGVDYPLIEFTNYAVPDASHFTLVPVTGLNPNQSAELVNNGSAIALRITGESLIWTGSQSSDWTTATVGGSSNWSYLGNGIEFSTNSPVIFDDTAANFSVNLAQNVSPNTVVFNNSIDYTLSSTGGFGISGGSLIKNGGGTLIITNTNTYTGSTIINAGVIQIGDGITDGSIATSSLITNNASLVFNVAGSQTVTNPIGGTGIVTKNGPGSLTLAGANNFTGGGVTLDSGILNVNHPSALGSTTAGTLTINGGILNNTSGAAITTTTAKAQTWAGDFTFTGTNNLNFNSGTVTLAGGGSRSVNVAAGILTVGAFSSPITGLSLSGPGVLAITSSVASNIGGTLDVAAGAKLRINTGADAGTTNDFIATGLTGNGTVENGGGVERWLFVDSGGTFNVGTTATKWLQVGIWDTAKGQVDVTSGNLKLNTNSAIKFNVQTGTGANVFNQSGGAVTFYSDNGTTVGGTGVLDMQTVGAAASSNTYNLNGGTLAVPQILSTATTGTRAFNFNGGTLKPTASTATFMNLGTGNARANVRNGGAVIHTNGFDVTVAQALVHSNVGGDNATDGGLTKQGGGILTLSSANTYTGATTISGGTLKLASTGSIGNSSTIINNATYDVSAATGYTVGINQTLSGSGTVIGNTTISGTLAVGNSPGAMTFNNDLALAGTALMELGGNAIAGTDYDYGNVLGTLTLGGALNITSYNGYDLAQTAAYNLFDAATTTGNFASVMVGGLGLTYSSGTDSWSGTSGATTYTFTEANGVLTAVPEPDAALLGGLGMLALLRRRRN